MAKVETRTKEVEYVITLSEAELKAIQIVVGRCSFTDKVKEKTGIDLHDLHNLFCKYIGNIA